MTRQGGPAQAQRRPHLYVGSPDLKGALAAELRRRAKDVVDVDDGLVRSGVFVDAVFARQVLRHAELVRGDTHNDLAAAVLACGGDASFAADAIDVDALELARTGSSVRTTHPLAAEAARLRETLQQKADGRRRKGKAGPVTKHRLRVLLTDARAAYVAVDIDVDGDPLTAWPSPFPLGRALPEKSKDAPSSAHRKLDEALAWLGTAPQRGEVVVDLGAAPGGWTRVCRDHGASVVAVDRAALDVELAKDPLVTHVKKDAADVDLAAYAPALVVCDVIWEPEKSVAVLRRALALPSVRALVVTLKLKDPIDFDVIDDARAALRGHDVTGRVKHLVANKREVTVMARRD